MMRLIPWDTLTGPNSRAPAPPLTPKRGSVDAMAHAWACCHHGKALPRELAADYRSVSPKRGGTT